MPPTGSPLQSPPRLVASDLSESALRVLRKTQWPTRRSIAEFFGNQLLVNAVAWSAGVVAVLFVRSFFEVRGVRNLWGLAAPHGRTLVGADDYHLIITLTAYSAGLVMMIVARQFILRMIAELRLVRAERLAAASPRATDPPIVIGALTPTLEGPELDLDA